MEKVSVLIPAYNEEKSISKCVISCLNQTKQPDEVVVINDGSKDNTLKILKYLQKKLKDGHRIKIVDLKKNTGNKSKAQEKGLKYVKGDIVIMTDGDTTLDKNFVKEIMKSFAKDKELVAVTGFVESKKNNWITSVREIDYLVCQTIYKQAQTKVGALFVLVGCGSGFRKKEFLETVSFDHDNITEDLDFTYQLKLAGKKLGFNDNAIIYTQDPNNLKSYFKQIYRWYSGGWTCLRKNFKILKKPNEALILSLIYLEGLILGGLFILSPLLLAINWKLFVYLFLTDFSVMVLSLAYGAIKLKRYGLFFFIPHHYFMHISNQIPLHFCKGNHIK
jgi:cellulose synthase/poly-beta-1,6-N-acetylglucosamine synthase-like glycosyltransferase